MTAEGVIQQAPFLLKVEGREIHFPRRPMLFAVVDNAEEAIDAVAAGADGIEFRQEGQAMPESSTESGSPLLLEDGWFELVDVASLEKAEPYQKPQLLTIATDLSSGEALALISAGMMRGVHAFRVEGNVAPAYQAIKVLWGIFGPER